MTDTASPDADDLLQRRMLALNGPDIRLRDWDASFVGDVCWRKPAELSPRQREMVALLCWRYRDQLAPGLAPASEPKLSPKPDREHFDTARRRQRGPGAPR